MKLIIAVIKPFKLDEVRDALAAAGVQGMTAADVRGFGRQKGQTEIYRGAEYTTNMVPKVRLEIVVDEGLAARVIETVQQVAHTGKMGTASCSSSMSTKPFGSAPAKPAATRCEGGRT